MISPGVFISLFEENGLIEKLDHYVWDEAARQIGDWKGGGDELVVIMMNMDSSSRDAVKVIIDQANVMLQKPTDDLPPVSLSVGVAFADRENPEGDIFKDADTALYRVKKPVVAAASSTRRASQRPG